MRRSPRNAAAARRRAGRPERRTLVPDGSQVLSFDHKGTQSVKVAPASGGAARTILPRGGMVFARRVVADGQRISFAFGTPDRAPDCTSSPHRRHAEADHLSDRGGTRNALVTPEKIAGRTRADDQRVLYKPKSLLRAGARQDHAVHGGPTSQVATATAPAQFFASRDTWSSRLTFAAAPGTGNDSRT